MRILFAGGGTAGHINPGVAIAKTILEYEKDAKILFVGTQKGLEAKLIPREGFDLKLITVRGFKRKLAIANITGMKEMFGSYFESRKIIKEFKPDIVVGTGGYVCGPVVFCAATMGIPTLIHEQNAFPGITNRILSKFCKVVALSFIESKKFFRGARRLELTGNPIRKEILSLKRETARQKLSIKEGEKLILIFGGSRGAERINQAVIDMLTNNPLKAGIRIVFATGEAGYTSIMPKLKNLPLEGIEILPYIFDMGTYLIASDLAVCRSGAITLAELTALGIPSILIPSPNVTANHQEYNARSLEKAGAAKVLLESALNGERLSQEILSLIGDAKKLSVMSTNSKNMGILDACDKIYALICELSNKKTG